MRPLSCTDLNLLTKISCWMVPTAMTGSQKSSEMETYVSNIQHEAVPMEIAPRRRISSIVGIGTSNVGP